MLDFITVPLVLTVIGATIYGIFELYARRRERLSMIERMSNISVDSNLNLSNYNPFKSAGTGRFIALKFGLLLMGVGLGIAIGLCVELGLDLDMESSYDERRIRDAIYGGFTLFFGGLGLLIAFITEHIMTKNDRAK